MFDTDDAHLYDFLPRDDAMVDAGNCVAGGAGFGTLDDIGTIY